MMKEKRKIPGEYKSDNLKDVDSIGQKAGSILKRVVILIQNVVKRFLSHGVPKSAAELSYYLLFSFFPLLIFVSILLGYMNIEPQAMIERMDDILPRDIITLIESYLRHVVTIQNGQLMVFGFLTSFWSVTRAVDSLMGSVGKAYGLFTPHGFIKKWLWKALISLMLMISIVIGLAFAIFGGSTMEFLSEIYPLSDAFINLWSYIRYPTLAIPVFLTLSLLYRVAPNFKYKFRFVFPGALLAILLFIATSVCFSFYVENMGNYSVLYGSLGAIIVLMLWLFMCSISLILGAEINHSIYLFLKKRSDQIQTDDII